MSIQYSPWCNYFRQILLFASITSHHVECFGSGTLNINSKSLKPFQRYDGYKLVSDMTMISVLAKDNDEFCLKCILKCVNLTGCSSVSVNLGNKECCLGSSYNGSHLGSAFDLDPNWTTFLDESYTGKSNLVYRSLVF